MLRKCLKEPIKEIYDASRYLDAAVSAHLNGKTDLAQELIAASDMPVIREWTESLWGAGGIYTQFQKILGDPEKLPKEKRIPVRMPNTKEKAQLQERDRFHCRFCEIPVIRKEVRELLKKAYPDVLKWGSTNLEQHSAFQAMWLQYDHLVPHARGGDNALSNIVITCAPCNFGRMNYLIEEVNVENPFSRPPIASSWDGLERIFDKNS